MAVKIQGGLGEQRSGACALWSQVYSASETPEHLHVEMHPPFPSLHVLGLQRSLSGLCSPVGKELARFGGIGKEDLRKPI